jgi:hypothetical protein
MSGKRVSLDSVKSSIAFMCAEAVVLGKDELIGIGFGVRHQASSCLSVQGDIHLSLED